MTNSLFGDRCGLVEFYRDGLEVEERRHDLGSPGILYITDGYPPELEGS